MDSPIPIEVEEILTKKLNKVADCWIIQNISVSLDTPSISFVEGSSLTREILISGLREFLAKGKIKLPVSNLAKLKTVLQMVSIALLLSGDTGNKIINFQDYNAQTVGIILLWLSSFLTLYTGYDYVRKGIDHAMNEDTKK